VTQPSTISIAGREIGPGHPPFIVAEISGNHGGGFERASKMVELAKQVGADAVKLQTYTADSITLDHDAPDFVIQDGLWKGRRLYDLYEEAYTPREWHAALFAKGRELGIPVFSAPFDHSAVDFLESLDPPAYKIASFELVDLPLVARVAATGKPVIISTGMADKSEIAEAVETARGAGCEDLLLLHCVSGYPTPAEDSNLKRMPRLAETFGTLVGLSDHSEGSAVAVASVALGASLIEKHFIDDRTAGGSDAAFSLEPEEMKALCETCRTAWAALGNGSFSLQPSEAGGRAFRRSLYAVEDIAAGEILTEQNIRSIRPAKGLPPKDYAKLLGRRAAVAIPRGAPLSWSQIESDSEG